MEGWVFSSSSPLSLHLSLVQTLFSIFQSSIHLVNISVFNPNIYPRFMQITYVAFVSCIPHMPFPSIIYTSICSPLCIWQTPLKQHKAQTLTFSVGALTLPLILRGDSNRSSLTLPSVHLMSSCCPLQTQASDISISQRGICLCDIQTDLCFKISRLHFGFITQKKQKKFLIVYFEQFSENQISSSIIQNLQVLSCVLKSLSPKGNKHFSSSIYHPLHCRVPLPYPSSFTLSIPASLLMEALRSAMYTVYAHD